MNTVLSALKDQQKEEKTFDLKDYILFTERDGQSWSYYKRQEASDWSAEEFEFVKEAQEYKDAPPNIQRLMDGIIAFFLIGDGLIAEEIGTLLKRAIEKKNWPKFFYLSMKLKIENTHAETYSKAALTIIPQEKHLKLFSMCKDLKCIREKGNWIRKHIDYNGSEALENVGCAASEGIFFVSLFAIIFYMRKLGLFDNFIESNEQISKDETTHRDEAADEAKRLLIREDTVDKIPWYITQGMAKSLGYRNIKSEIPQATQIIKEAVEIEKTHAEYLLQEPILGKQADEDSGLTLENLHLYIEKLADEICMLVDIPTIYNNKDIRLPWMEDINMSQKSNFYERDVIGNYRRFDPKAKSEVVFNNPSEVSF